MNIERIVSEIKKGNLVITPTDTVYGILADSKNIDAIKKVFFAKKRNFDKPLILLASDYKMIKDYTKNISHYEKSLIKKFMPGKVTILLPKNNKVSNLVVANLDLVGVRIPDNADLRTIIKKIGHPLISTSANIAGNKVISKPSDIEEEMLKCISYIEDGGKIDATPSTLFKVVKDELVFLREGELSSKIVNYFNIIKRKEGYNMEIIAQLKNANVGEISENIKTSTLTTYKTGGIALGLVHPKNVSLLKETIDICKKNNINFMIIGNGSNLLFSDNFYNGILIKLDNLCSWQNVGKGILKADSGMSLIKLVNESAKLGLSGLEFAASIPGSIGGAVYMNAGAFGSDISKVTKSVTVLTDTGEIIDIENKNMNFGYRTSLLKENKKYICLSVTLKLKEDIVSDIMTRIKSNREARNKTQPLVLPNAGSVFRNPFNDYAGRLIEELGLKGYKMGGAMVSEKHANFVVNYDNATSDDIKGLIDYVHDKVKENYNVDMLVEQEFVNF